MNILHIIKVGLDQDRDRISDIDWQQTVLAILGAVCSPLYILALLFKPLLVTWWLGPFCALWMRRKDRQLLESGEWRTVYRGSPDRFFRLVHERMRMFPDDPVYTELEDLAIQAEQSND